jgi:hypothetical protein
LSCCAGRGPGGWASVVAREGAHERVAGARGAVATGLPGIERGTDREDLHIRPIGPESVDSGLSRVAGSGGQRNMWW